MFCCKLLYVLSSIAIILMGKRELVALLNLSSWRLLMVEQLFLAVPLCCLQFVIVVFPDHTYLLFSMLNYQNDGKHNCTRSPGMYVTVAPDQQPCLYTLHTISMHICYSFYLIIILVCFICTKPSAISVTLTSAHLPCLQQLHLTCSDVCLTCTYNHACLKHLHCTSSSIHIC